jgi:peroxiredoxin Q/BCP
MARVAIGKRVPEFAAASTAGDWRLKSASGGKLVLYFYPKDNTTGCTREAEEFRDRASEFRKARALLIGVSPDSVASHEKFKAKFSLPFELLADPAHELCELFGVWKEKSMYGRKYMGVERSTFLLDAGGVLRGEWRKVKVPGHADEVLAAARAL